MTCSALYAPIRWILRDPTFGHVLMHPSPKIGHGLELRCAECLKTWSVTPTFKPSPIFEHRAFVAGLRGVGRILGFRKKVA